MDEVGVAEIVKATLGEDLSTGLEPDGFLEVDPDPLLEHLWCDAAQCTQHGPPAMDDLHTNNTVI